MKLVIDRSKWGCGALLNKDGTMCCLGFLSKACGYNELRLPAPDWYDSPTSSALGFPDPDWVNVPAPFIVLEKDTTGKAVWRTAAKINDDVKITWASKESLLITLFAKHGVELSFEGPPKDKV